MKLCGDDPRSTAHAAGPRGHPDAGGAARANVFTRFALALFEQVPWRAVPVMPVEIMLLPRWAPFHLSKVSYWSRTVIVPLLVLTALKPKALNPRAVNIRELFVVPPEEERTYLTNPTGSAWGNLFLAIDKALRICEPLLPKNARQRSIQAAIDWIAERLNGEDGLGGIFPAMANAVMAYRRPGLRARPSAAGDRHGLDPQAAGAGRDQRLLRTLYVADLGHGPGDDTR